MPNVTQINIRKVVQEKAPGFYPKIPDFVFRYLERTIHQDEMNDILVRYQDSYGTEFMNRLITHFDLTLDVHGLDRLPDNKRYIFVSNHPLGGLDGICLSSVIGRHFDGHIRYLVNDLLLYLPNLQSIFIPINKHGAQNRENARLIEEAYASDNQIINFPAGLCSRKIRGRITDLEWKKSFVQKAVEYQRDVVPIFFGGQNSAFFYRFANIRKRLGIKLNIEMIYLPDEMFRCKHSRFPIYFGEPIPWQTFDKSRRPGEWAEWVKEIVYKLQAKQ